MPEMTFGMAIHDAMNLEMDRDPKIYIAGEDVTHGGAFRATAGLVDKYGKKRVRDTPISESAIIGSAVGAAACGLRPIVELMFVDFIGVCLDQLFNQAAKMKYMFGGKAKLPIVMRSNCGAGVSAAAHHSQSLEVLFMHIPGLKVAFPSTPIDAKGLMISAIRDDNPVVFLEHKMLIFTQGEVPEGDFQIPFGEADIKREGEDVTVVATGAMVPLVLGLAEKLSNDGISVEVVDPRTLSPLDEETILESVKKTNHLVIVHEAVKFAGSGAEIAAMVAEKALDDLDGPIVRVGAPFTPVPFSPVLEKAYIPSEEKVMEAINTALGRE
jgi:pyruvate dehydrogenase E1 component beta subunit